MIAAKIKATQGSEGARRATEIPWGGTPKEVNLHQGAAAAPPDPEVPANPTSAFGGTILIVSCTPSSENPLFSTGGLRIRQNSD
jgi:hypothetical protein